MSMNPKVPAVVSVGLICLVLGAGGGAVLTTVYGSLWGAPTAAKSGDEVSPEEGAAKMGGAPKMEGMGKGKGGMGKGGFGKGKGKGKGPDGPPSPRSQLATLVTKLDQLTREPLTVKLNDEQKAKLGEQLAGLEKMDSISEDEAKKRLDAILDIVKENRETLEAAGFAMSGRRPPADSPNPFKEGSPLKHLEGLRERVGKGKD
jgi:hypothetical protein